MDIPMVKQLTKFQFREFDLSERPSVFHHLVEEHEWYADDNDSTLGVLFRDKIDND